MINTSSNHPIFSIVIATYNSSETVEECLKSIFQQEGGLYELLIVDGGSTDGTLDIIEPFSDKIKTLISEPDDGVYDAWNKVLGDLDSDWTLFLGSDDCFENNNSLIDLNRYLKVQDFGDALFIFSPVNVVDNIQNKHFIDSLGNNDLDYFRNTFKQEMLFSHTGCLHKTDLFRKGLRFDKSYKIAGDYEFLLRSISGDISKIAKYDSILVLMGQGGLSTSSKSRVIAYSEGLRARYNNKLYIPSLRLIYRVMISAICWAVEKTMGDAVLLFLSNCYRKIIGKPSRISYK